MPIRQTIPSEFMTGPRLADLARRPPAPPAPPAPAAAAASDLDPVFARAIEVVGDPAPRDRVTDAAEPESAFAFRVAETLLAKLPEPARALLRRLDRAATEARDMTVALGRHIDAAGDRIGRVNIDVRAAIQYARLNEVQNLEAARAIVASDRWPVGFTEPMKATVRRIVAEGERLAEAQAEHAELIRRRQEHATRTAPLLALRRRLADAAAKLRPPIRPLELPSIDAKRAERTIADARQTIAAARADIEAIETAPPAKDEVLALATAAVRRYGAQAGLGSVVRWNGVAFTIAEPMPGLDTEDRRPLRPLALLCAIAPELVAGTVANMVRSAPDAPLVAHRPSLLAEARQRLRAAEIAERAAIAALGDPLDAFRADADPLVTLAVEGGR